MSTVLASATKRLQWAAAFLFAVSSLASGCGGKAIEDEGGTGAAQGSGGVSMAGGGAGSSPAAGGSSSGGGGVATGGFGGGEQDCNLTTIECTSGSSCACAGVFEDCGYSSIHCEPDAEGQPTGCVCGDPTIGVDECEYDIQYRCDPPEVMAWLKTCACDPVTPTDEEPCRYHQEMYDRLGEDRTCSMAVADVEPNEKHKYSCHCGLPD